MADFANLEMLAENQTVREEDFALPRAQLARSRDSHRHLLALELSHRRWHVEGLLDGYQDRVIGRCNDPKIGCVELVDPANENDVRCLHQLFDLRSGLRATTGNRRECHGKKAGGKYGEICEIHGNYSELSGEVWWGRAAFATHAMTLQHRREMGKG
jgi:hypothetical protein